MYKIIGADQKEYGPISADQMRQWFAEGRVNAQTLVWSETSGNWKPLSQYPELVTIVPPTYAPGGNVFGADPAVGRANAAQKVLGPAIGLMITSILSIGMFVNSMISNEATRTLSEILKEAGSAGADLERMIAGVVGTVIIVACSMGIAFALLIFVGAWRMKNLSSYALSMIACIMAMIPCFSNCCCLIGLPIGIWGLIVLNAPDVKPHFR
jgi:hypothetical protein